MEEQANLTLEIEQSERRVERLLHAPPSDIPSTVLALIERVALDPRADVEKLERMMAMYERLKAIILSPLASDSFFRFLRYGISYMPSPD
jgi:hypothetical protein